MVDMLTYDEDLYWIALSYRYTPMNLSPVLRLYEELGSIRYLWDMSPVELCKRGFNDRAVVEISRIRKHATLEQCEKMKQRLDDLGVRLLKYPDSGYPRQLRVLSGAAEGAPIMLYHHGALANFERCVSIVGTRVLSHYGHSAARRLARSLASERYTIVSGLAKGTDTEAHCGALEALGGQTIAVTAWLEPIYPPDNAELHKDIAQRGCVLSEFLCGTLGSVAKSAFVRRNRITSGLSQCLIAIESDEEGGTAHQVRFAISQGKKVFALEPLPGNTRARRGFELFVKLGAVAFRTDSQVLQFLRGFESSSQINRFVHVQGDLRTHLR